MDHSRLTYLERVQTTYVQNVSLFIERALCQRLTYNIKQNAENLHMNTQPEADIHTGEESVWVLVFIFSTHIKSIRLHDSYDLMKARCLFHKKVLLISLIYTCINKAMTSIIIYISHRNFIRTGILLNRKSKHCSLYFYGGMYCTSLCILTTVPPWYIIQTALVARCNKLHNAKQNIDRSNLVSSW